ncbi:MAG: hypothetical protein KC657_37755 [Myxococcales bacterium]|nr:hypothetical protein [Myxococcales bacterium]
MNSSASRSIALLLALAAAAGGALVHCAAPAQEEEELTEDEITGVNNKLGLGLRFDEKSGAVQATLKKDLREGEQLFVRVRRGKLTLKSQKELDCKALATQVAPVQALGKREVTGKTVYQGPKVDRSVFDLVHLFDDARWADNSIPAATRDEVKQLGPDPIVEACIIRGNTVRAKLQTNLVYAWDQGTKDVQVAKALGGGGSLRFMNGDGGLEGDGGEPDPDAGAPEGESDGGLEGGGNNGGAPRITEDNVSSQIEYGQLCVEQLGEIPFFKKLGPGKYDTFDCRDLVGTNEEGVTGPIPGVEGAGIPAMVDGVQQTKCSPGQELGMDDESYGCLDKADHGMYLATGKTQPGPMVVTAKNDQGTHWLLLCRKVSDDGNGMMKTKTFNDVAMIGHNPATGRTCFFQNSIGTGRDGAHVPHPADVEKSTSMWSSSVQSYCSGSCHASDPFVHSPWIDGAKRANGKPIVPKMGELSDFLVSNAEAPYSIIGADKLGFKLPKQLVSDEVGACSNCHRLSGNTLGKFANWATGTGDDYYANITEFGKQFNNSHWMPPRLDGLTADNWATSKYGRALEVMKTCSSNENDPLCIWADVPRGRFVNPTPRPND